MKDHQNTAKRGRGRPATGKALSNAERQRLYRERQKAQRNEKGSPELAAALEKIKKLEAEIKQLKAGYNVLELGPRCRKWKTISWRISLNNAKSQVEGCNMAAKEAKMNYQYEFEPERIA